MRIGAVKVGIAYSTKLAMWDVIWLEKYKKNQIIIFKDGGL